MRKTVFETIVGALVIAVAVGFMTFVYDRTSAGDATGFEVFARFSTVDGLSIGDDVPVSAIKIGTVVDQTLDPAYFRAVVHRGIDPGVALPEDTSAAVVSQRLVGGKYVATEPGGMDEIIPGGSEIKLARSAVNLESLLCKFIYNAGGGRAARS